MANKWYSDSYIITKCNPVEITYGFPNWFKNCVRTSVWTNLYWLVFFTSEKYAKLYTSTRNANRRCFRLFPFRFCFFFNYFIMLLSNGKASSFTEMFLFPFRKTHYRSVKSLRIVWFCSPGGSLFQQFYVKPETTYRDTLVLSIFDGSHSPGEKTRLLSESFFNRNGLSSPYTTE